MARRNRDLAGLAALGALGYMATRGRDDARGVGQGRKESVESEERLPLIRTEDDRDIGMISGASPSGLYRNTESGDLFSVNRPEKAVSTPRQRPVVATPGGKVAPAAANRSMAAARESQEPYKNPQRGPSFEEISAYNRSQQMAGASTKPREGMVQASTRSMTPTRPQTREEAIAQIPGQRASSVPSDTDPSLREDSTELGRNVRNTLAALTPLGGGFGKVGAELATAKGAAERAAKSRELAQEAIRTQKPTKFSSTKSTAPGRTSETTKSRVKKFSEEEAGVEFKRGGSAKVKKMASGGFTSASKRADGIASRGKTKCKMY